MKSMKGWFAVYPVVSSCSRTVHFLSQRPQRSRRDLIGESLFIQWGRQPKESLDFHDILFVFFRAFRGKEVIHQSHFAQW
jgi:hypothetical protein